MLILIPKFLPVSSEATKADDLVSLAYTLIFLVKGGLPWQSAYETFRSSQHISDFERLATAKEEVEPEVLCAGIPAVYRDFLSNVLKLLPKATPDYDLFQEAFREYSERRSLSGE